MPTFHVTAPDGTHYEINGPDGATEEQAMDQAMAQHAIHQKAVESATNDYYDPTEGMSTGEKLAAGAGKALVDLGRGAGQWLGLESRQDVQDSRDRDKALMNTTAGKVGNIGGNILATLPALAIPGVNTAVGAAALGAGLGALQPSTSATETATNIGLGGATGYGGQVLGGKLAQLASRQLQSRAALASLKQAQNADRDGVLHAAQAKGYVVPPTAANPNAVNTVMESYAGKVATRHGASTRNALANNQAVRDDLSLPADSPITRPVLEGVRRQAGQVYENVKQALPATFNSDPAYKADIASIRGGFPDLETHYPGITRQANPDIQALADSLDTASHNGPAALELSKRLRSLARSNIQAGFGGSGRNSQLALGRAQMEGARAIEDQIQRQLANQGQADLGAAWDTARTQYAKSYQAQAALQGGNIIGARLATQMRKGKLSTGNMGLAAKFADYFPEVSAVPKSGVGVSKLAAVAGSLSGGAALYAHSPFLAALSAAVSTMPYPLRAGMLSRMGQRALAQPNYAPSLTGTAALSGARQLGRIGQLAPAAALPMATGATQQGYARGGSVSARLHALQGRPHAQLRDRPAHPTDRSDTDSLLGDGGGTGTVSVDSAGTDSDASLQANQLRAARGGVVHMAGGGDVGKAIQKIAESLEQISARRALEQQHAKAGLPGQFSTLDQLIQQAPASVTKPEQWQGYLKPGKAFTREGVQFPLKQDELDFTGTSKLLDLLKNRESPAPENFQLAPTNELTPRQQALLNFHQDLRDKGLGHYETPEDMQRAWFSDTPHPQTGHVLTPDDTEVMDKHLNIMSDLEGDPDAEAAKNPFSDQNLGNMNKQGVSKNDLLNWLRTHRPAIQSQESTEYVSHVPGYLKGQRNAGARYAPSTDYVADLTQIPEHWDPQVTEQINRFGGHFSPRPLSWSRSARSTNPAGQTGRTIAEIQSDVHQKAGDKVATPPPELRTWLGEQMNNPVLPPSVREALPQLPGMEERLLSTGETPPEGMSVRPRGYGPLSESDQAQRGIISPLYEGLPFKKLEGYAPMEMRKQLARSANEGSDWLAMVSGADQGQSGARAAAMAKVYGAGDPQDMGIYPTMLQKLARQYNIPFDPSLPIATKVSEDRPAANQPITLTAQTPYNIDALRATGRVKANRTYGAGDHVRDQQRALQAKLEAALPDGDLRGQIATNPDVFRPAVRNFATNTNTLAQNYAQDISAAHDAGLINWDMSNQARDLRYSVKKLADKVTDWNARMPGPTTLRDKMNQLEAIHNQIKPLVDAHNARLAANADAPPETINRPAMLLDPETRARIQRIGVPLFSAAGAGLGLNAAQDQSQDQTPGFAYGGLVQRFGEGGVAKAIKKAAESLEEIGARRTLEQRLAKAPTPGQFSVLDKVIQGAPDDLNTPDKWQSYLANPGRSFVREGVNFPLKKEETEFTGVNTLLQKLKDRVAPPPVKVHPALRDLVAFASSPQNVEVGPHEKALGDFKDWLEANRGPLGVGDAPIKTPMDLYVHAGNMTPLPAWRAGGDNPLWNGFYQHYQNVEDTMGKAAPPDPFAAGKLAAQNLTPDSVTKNDLLTWLRNNRPSVTGATKQNHPENRPPWLNVPGNPYREELSIIGNHWDPNVIPAIQRNTGHYGQQPVSWSRSTDVTDPSGNMGRVIHEIQSDVHGKAGNRVATPPPELANWAQNMPSFVPDSMRQRVLSSDALHEKELSTEADVPQGMGLRRIGYGPLSETMMGHTRPGIIPKIYEGVPLQGLEGYPPFEMRRNFADAANTNANFLGMGSGKDQKDIYGDRQGPKWQEAMRKVYGTPETPGFYEGTLRKLASQYGLPYKRDYAMGFERPAGQRTPITVADNSGYDASVARAHLGLPDDAPVTLGDYANAKMSTAQTKLNAATPGLPPETNLRDRMRAASRGESEAAQSAYYEPGNFKQHMEDKLGNMYYDLSNAQDRNILPPDLYSIGIDAYQKAQEELGKVNAYGEAKQWPDPNALKGHLDTMEDAHKQALGFITAHNEAIRNPPKGAPISRPAILMSPEDRERIKRIGVPLFTGAGAALGLQAANNASQGSMDQSAPQGFAGGGLAETPLVQAAVGTDPMNSPAFKRLLAAQLPYWTRMDPSGHPHPSISRHMGLAEFAQSLPYQAHSILGAVGGGASTDYNRARYGSPTGPDSSTGDALMKWSQGHYNRYENISNAMQRKLGVPDASTPGEFLLDAAGSMIPATLPASVLARSKTLSALMNLMPMAPAKSVPGIALGSAGLNMAAHALAPDAPGYSSGGVVSPFHHRVRNHLDAAIRLGKLADKVYPHYASKLKSPLSPKPKPRTK